MPLIILPASFICTIIVAALIFFPIVLMGMKVGIPHEVTGWGLVILSMLFVLSLPFLFASVIYYITSGIPT